jgi:formylaminopyrimidine deformylase / aminopyrimidine aminohydrolase
VTGHVDALLAGQAERWSAMARHPFVVQAADGTLPPEVFDRWLVQDHFFVVGFRRFLARLVELAPDEAARDVMVGGLGALQGELDLFRAEAEARRLDLDEEPSLTTLGYTSYLLAAPADGWPTALTVLFGAEKAYFDAWSAVRRATDPTSPYWRFVDNWSSPAFGSWVDAVGGLVDALPHADHGTFDRVVRFELAFWDAVATNA